MGLLEGQDRISTPAIPGEDALPESVAAYQEHIQNASKANRRDRRAARKTGLSREIRMRALRDKATGLWMRAASKRLGSVSATWVPKQSHTTAKRGKRS